MRLAAEAAIPFAPSFRVNLCSPAFVFCEQLLWGEQRSREWAEEDLLCPSIQHLNMEMTGKGEEEEVTVY